VNRKTVTHCKTRSTPAIKYWLTIRYRSLLWKGEHNQWYSMQFSTEYYFDGPRVQTRDSGDAVMRYRLFKLVEVGAYESRKEAHEAAQYKGIPMLKFDAPGGIGSDAPEYLGAEPVTPTRPLAPAR